jgi:hypothetical protein
VARTLFAVGVVAYLASFFLVGVYGFDGPVRGYVCAWLALWTPLTALDGGQQGVSASGSVLWPLMLFAMFIAGLVNIAFPIAVFLRLTAHSSSPGFQRLRVYIPLMAACSWLVFVLAFFIPREGHLSWIVGIVLALFPEDIGAYLTGTTQATMTIAAPASKRPRRFRLYE